MSINALLPSPMFRADQYMIASISMRSLNSPNRG